MAGRTHAATIENEAGVVVATGLSPADAEFIIATARERDALAEALRELLSTIGREGHVEQMVAVDEARLALAALDGGK